MPIRSDDLFLVASQLPEGAEPFDRSAVSRLYYGVYHQAMEFLRARHAVADFRPQVDPRTGRPEGSHQAVINRLTSVDQSAAAILNQLRLRRVAADYELASDWGSTWRAEAQELVDYLRGRFGTR